MQVQRDWNSVPDLFAEVTDALEAMEPRVAVRASEEHDQYRQQRLHRHPRRQPPLQTATG